MYRKLIWHPKNKERKIISKNATRRHRAIQECQYIIIVREKETSYLLIKPSSILLIPAHRHKNHAHENYLKIEHNFAHYPHSIENEANRQVRRAKKE